MVHEFAKKYIASKQFLEREGIKANAGQTPNEAADDGVDSEEEA